MSRILLSEPDGYALLAAHSVPIPMYRVADTAEEAAIAAETLGYPVVMKVISPDIVHKSDFGGVITGIGTAPEARRAFDQILQNARSHKPDAQIRGILVEQQALPGLELILGGRTDPTFGKVITIGLGGTLVELLRDVSIRILPIDTDEITPMIREMKGYPLLAGYRDEPPRDMPALAKIIGSVATMFYADPHIEEFDINPLILYTRGACAVDARIYRNDSDAPRIIPPVREMPDRLFDINSIAIVGASSDPGKVGYAVCRNLLPFPGRVYPINPKGGMILAKTVYPSLAAIPDTVDLAVITIPAAGVPAVIDEAGAKKIPLSLIISSGFRESGAPGRDLEERILKSAHTSGMRIIGPNCLGLMLPHQGINTTFDPVSPRPGHIAFISQSGAIITTIVDWSLQEEIGFSAVISVGNQSDLTFEDFIRFAGDYKETRAIILYIEQILDGTRFREIVNRISPLKPIIAIKSGSSRIGKLAASSHTGALAGSHATYLAAFRQSGAIPVSSIRTAFQSAELLSSEGYPQGTRALVISNAGGFAVLSSDYAERYGITMTEFPEDLIKELDGVLPANWSRANPIDMVGDSNADRFARAFDIVAQRQDLWDIAFVIVVPSAISDPVRVANEIVRFSRLTHKMVVGCMIGGDSMKTPVHILRDAHIPNFSDLEDAFRVVGNICRHRCSSEGSACRHGLE